MYRGASVAARRLRHESPSRTKEDISKQECDRQQCTQWLRPSTHEKVPLHESSRRTERQTEASPRDVGETDSVKRLAESLNQVLETAHELWQRFPGGWGSQGQAKAMEPVPDPAKGPAAGRTIEAMATATRVQERYR